MNGTNQRQQQPGGGDDAATAFQARIDTLLELVTARARGEVRTETVEDAVARLLSTVGGVNGGSTGGGTTNAAAAPAAAAAGPSLRASSSVTGGGRVVVEDEEDYDDLEDTEPTTAASSKPAAAAPAPDDVAERNGKRGRKRRRTSSATNKGKNGGDEDYVDEEEAKAMKGDADDDDDDDGEIDKSKHWDELDAIALGRVGAKMMVTFGDGRNPRPKTVEAALLGARRLIQHAVRDARALRRRHKAEYKKAQAAVTLHTKRPKYIDKETISSLKDTTVDSSMLFRAIGGYDRLSYDPKCGFDVPELEVLFPEEMMAYERWKRMQKAYAQSKEDRGDGSGLDNDEGDDEEEAKEASSDSAAAAKKEEEDNTVGGHLNRRLKQFDARTEQMKEKWYLSFSEVRQGSFIDKATGADGRMWREAQKKRKHDKKEGRGRPSRNVTWESLPPGCVTFLHWIGFDITSAIPPPNEATANALAFLAYDFMGKIVEKAIFLRCLAQRNEAKKTKRSGEGGDDDDSADDGDDFLLELKGKEQLSVEDIDRALKDSTVVSEPLYGASNSTLGGDACKPQLYFGPGFEERLEMEMDEIVHKGKTEISEEEQNIRQQEDQLFAEMEKPPTRLEGVMDVLGEEHMTDEMLKKREASKAKQKSNALRASAQKDGTAKKRARGRPRKNK